MTSKIIDKKDSYKSYKKYKAKYKKLKAGTLNSPTNLETIKTACDNSTHFTLIPDCQVNPCREITSINSEIDTLKKKLEKNQNKINSLELLYARLQSIPVIQEGIVKVENTKRNYQ